MTERSNAESGSDPVSRDAEVGGAWNQALGYMARRDRTVAELAGWLDKKGCPAEGVTEIIEKMKSLGYLDDAAYAIRYAESRAARGYGDRRIYRELAQRGVAQELVRAALDLAKDEGSERATVRRLVEQRTQRLRSELDTRRRKKKVFDFLVRRGYSPSMIREVIDQVLT